MSDLKSTKSWHIQNLIDVEDDCQVVMLEDALVLEQQRDRLKEVNAELLEALIKASEALCHCKADTGYASMQTRAAISINSAIAKATEGQQ